MWMAALLPLALQSCGGGTSGGSTTTQPPTANTQQQPAKQHLD